MAAGCERKREREARERAVAKARGSRDRDDSFVAAVHHRGAINSQRSYARPPAAPLPARVVFDFCVCDAELAPCNLDDRRGDAPGADGGGGGGGAGG